MGRGNDPPKKKKGGRIGKGRVAGTYAERKKKEKTKLKKKEKECKDNAKKKKGRRKIVGRI